MSKVLKKTTVAIKKEPHLVLYNWDYVMALIICGTHLDREVHAAEDLLDPVQKEFGGYEQPLRNKGKGSGRALGTPTKTTSTTESATA